MRTPVQTVDILYVYTCTTLQETLKEIQILTKYIKHTIDGQHETLCLSLCCTDAKRTLHTHPSY